MMLSPIKLGITAATLILVASGAYWKGSASTQAKWDKVSAAQTIANQKKEIENAELVMFVATAYNSESERLRDKLSTMSKVPRHTGKSPVPIAELSGTCTDTFYDDALQDAQQLNALIDLVRRVCQ